MSKKRKKPGKLMLDLLGTNLVCIIISVFLYILLIDVGRSLINKYLIDSSYINQKKQEVLADFKSYIKDENVSIYDYGKIDTFVKSRNYLEIYIFKDKNILYDSAYRKNTNIYKNIVAESNIAAYFNSITFSDSDADIYLDYYIEYKFYHISTFASAIISILFFNMMMILLINEKIKYIKTVENEIKILEGGNLNHEITIKGNDELTYLAESIDEMRKSIIERLENEDELSSANKELITAMSHDLRTPLTAIVGYLDIIELKKYKTEENLMCYIHNCREKAYQIKYMSDKLFEYFLVFNNHNEMEFENYNGNGLLEQLIQENFFLLSNKDFKFNLIHCDKSFFFDINLIAIRRVFDNIFSNIQKYADNKEVIDVEYYAEGNRVFITFENIIKKELNNVSSTEIGLKTCKKIIEYHKGQFLVSSTENHFKIIIILPIHYH